VRFTHSLKYFASRWGRQNIAFNAAKLTLPTR
jgi:hypothetical protein